MKVPAANCDMIHWSLREAFWQMRQPSEKRERGNKPIQVRKQICSRNEEINDLANLLNKIWSSNLMCALNDSRGLFRNSRFWIFKDSWNFTKPPWGCLLFMLLYNSCGVNEISFLNTESGLLLLVVHQARRWLSKTNAYINYTKTPSTNIYTWRC